MPASGEPRCATALCFGADLAETGDSLVRSMGGYPGFGPVSLADLRVIGTAGPCADGCTLAAGYAARQNAPALYYYNGARDDYDTLDEGSSVDAWSGLWAAVLPTIEGDLGLLFPAE